MPRDADDLLAEALALPEEGRARVARVLIDSLEVGDDEEGSPAELEAAWREEVELRERNVGEDASLLVPGETVFAEAERRLREIRAARGGRRSA